MPKDPCGYETEIDGIEERILALRAREPWRLEHALNLEDIGSSPRLLAMIEEGVTVVLADVLRPEMAMIAIPREQGQKDSQVVDLKPSGCEDGNRVSHKRFGIKGKLSPRFIGPFEILDRVGEVSYRLALPPQLSHVHNVFHVSLLRGYKYHPLHVISYPFDQIREDLSYTEEPESILDRQDRVMRNKTIPFVKILWRNHPEREATWETEESIRTSYPHFLP
ncbi:putative nucleotidyltransferase, ribonuclease H [Tanacetum coccineum]